MSTAISGTELEKLQALAAVDKHSWLNTAAWLGIAAVLAWAWQGAEILSLIHI